MTDNNLAQNNLDAVALWRSLRDYLRVAIEVLDGAESHTGSTPVTVRFTVTNTAPGGSDGPEIVFEEVRLRISSGGSGSSSRQIGPELTSGQSLTYEHKCDYRDIAAIDAQVEANVSRRRFFHIQRAVAFPSTLTRPTALAYLQAFNNIHIHAVLDSTMASFSPPGPETTFAQLRALTATLDTALSEIDGIQNHLRLPARDLGESSMTHVKAAAAYVTKVLTGFSDMKDAILSADPEKIAASAEAIAALESEAAEVNRATEELMDKYAISDEEVNYRYRGR